MADKIYKKYLFVVLAGIIAGFFAMPQSAVGAKKLLAAPDVLVSSDNLLQADTLLVVVKNEQNDITGTFGQVSLHFSRSQDGKDWVAITGAVVKKSPGNYKLTIKSPGKKIFQEDIKVSARKFPVIPYTATKELEDKGLTPEENIKNITTTEKKALGSVLDLFNPEYYFTKPFVNPLSEIKVTGPYGDIKDYNNYKIMHVGVDLRAATGTAVFAVNDGLVSFEENLPDYGNTLVLDHGLGMYSMYCHLSEFKAKLGDMAKQGDVIALSGDTGYVTGPHLHFAIRVRGSSLDPLKFIQATQLLPW